MTREAVLKQLRKLCAEAGGPTDWAIRHGMRVQYVYLALSGKRPPGPKILRAMGIKRDEHYSRLDAA